MLRKLSIGVLLAFVALGVQPSTQGRSIPLTLVGTIDLGPNDFSGVSVMGDLVFVGQAANVEGGGSVVIFDIADPAHPIELGATPRFPAASHEESQAAEIGGRPVLAISVLSSNAASRGLKLFDISDPSSPVLVGAYDPGAGVLGGAISFDLTKTPDGRTLALLSAGGSEVVTSNLGTMPGLGDLQIVDISDPANPGLIGEWGVIDEPALGWEFFVREQRGARADVFAERVFASEDGRRAYLTYSDHGTMILDLSDPSAPILIGRAGFEPGEEGNSKDVRPARGGTLLVRSHLVRFPFQIHVSSDALSAVRTAGESLATPAIYGRPAHQISGEVVFLGTGCPAVSYPADPDGKIALMTAHGCPLGQKVARAQTAGATAVVFYREGPIPQPGQFLPAVGSFVTLPDGSVVPVTIPVIGADQNTGRCLAQLRDPSGDLIAAGCKPADPVSLTATSVFQGYGGLQVFDTRNPASPVRLSTFRTPNSADVNVALAARSMIPIPTYTATHIEVRGQTVYAGWEYDGLRVFDISRPGAPVEIGAWNGEGRPAGAPPVRGWQVVPHRNLILFSSLFDAVYILRAGPASGVTAGR